MRAEDFIPGDMVCGRWADWEQPNLIREIETIRGKTVITFAQGLEVQVMADSTFFTLYDEGPGIPL